MNNTQLLVAAANSQYTLAIALADTYSVRVAEKLSKVAQK